VLFHGAPGSGKTALMHTFVREFYINTVDDGRVTMKDCVYHTTGDAVVANVKKWKQGVEHWKKKLDHKIKKTQVVPPLKCVVIDKVSLSTRIHTRTPPLFTQLCGRIHNTHTRARTPPLFTHVYIQLDAVPPALQQTVRMLMDAYAEDDVRFVFTSPTPKSLVEGIRSSAYILKLVRLPEKEMLRIALASLVKERIGYEKDGIELLFKYTGEDLGLIHKTIQGVFTKYAYLSYENVMKCTFPELAKRPKEVPYDAVLQPIPRCDKCLLPPPCRHISKFDLATRAKERRKELPKWGLGSMTCARFSETGCCQSFNKVGRCSCNHPQDVHTVIYPCARCPVCSLPKPCGKCEYTKRREALEEVVTAAGGVMGEYYKKVATVEELAGAKIKGGQMGEAQNEKVKERAAACRAGVVELAEKLAQMTRYLANNVDSIDSAAYVGKTKWIKGYVENAQYTVDRALHEWRPRRDRRDGGGLEEGSSLEESDAGGRGERGERKGGRGRGR